MWLLDAPLLRHAEKQSFKTWADKHCNAAKHLSDEGAYPPPVRCIPVTYKIWDRQQRHINLGSLMHFVPTAANYYHVAGFKMSRASYRAFRAAVGA